jgi:tetratricopeptide (TPR) repeat protein
MVLFNQTRYPEAKSAFEEAVRQKPDFYDAYRWLGHIADIEGNHLQAIRFYEICSRIKPFSEEPLVFIYMGYMRMGETAKAKEELRKVIDVAERIIELNPDNTVTLSRMAMPLFEFGQKERALEILRRIIEMDPADGLVLYNCGCAYAMMGKKEEALAAVQRAVEKGYKNTVAWMKIDPDLASIAGEPEFKALLAKYG